MDLRLRGLAGLASWVRHLLDEVLTQFFKTFHFFFQHFPSESFMMELIFQSIHCRFRKSIRIKRYSVTVLCDLRSLGIIANDACSLIYGFVVSLNLLFSLNIFRLYWKCFLTLSGRESRFLRRLSHYASYLVIILIAEHWFCIATRLFFNNLYLLKLLLKFFSTLWSFALDTKSAVWLSLS